MRQPRLTADEEVIEWRRFHDCPTQERREFLLASYYRIAMYCVNRFKLPHAECDDAEAVALIALNEAIDRYSTKRGAKFSSYAIKWICGKLAHYKRDHLRLIKARAVDDAAVSWFTGIALYRRVYGIEPETNEDFAEFLGCPLDIVQRAEEIKNLGQPVSLDDPLGGDGEDRERTLHDTLGDSSGDPSNRIEFLYIAQAIDRLEPRLKRVIIERYYRQATQANVATLLGISQMHVSRLEHMALHQLEQILKTRLPGTEDELDEPEESSVDEATSQHRAAEKVVQVYVTQFLAAVKRKKQELGNPAEVEFDPMSGIINPNADSSITAPLGVYCQARGSEGRLYGKPNFSTRSCAQRSEALTAPPKQRQARRTRKSESIPPSIPASFAVQVDSVDVTVSPTTPMKAEIQPVKTKLFRPTPVESSDDNLPLLPPRYVAVLIAIRSRLLPRGRGGVPLDLVEALKAFGIKYSQVKLIVEDLEVDEYHRNVNGLMLPGSESLFRCCRGRQKLEEVVICSCLALKVDAVYSIDLIVDGLRRRRMIPKIS